MSGERAIRQYLQMLIDGGVTHIPTVTPPTARPRTRLTAPIKRSPAAKSERPSGVASQALAPAAQLMPPSASRPPASTETTEILGRKAESHSQKQQALADLAKIVSGCRRCKELAECRTQTVFGVGHPNADVLFLGEAPGADEDKQGEPFVGRAGQLMDKIIEATRMKREDIYICNILRCRPPGNRNPLPEEAANCREYLDAQIQTVNPRYIVCWGAQPVKYLLEETLALSRLRGRFHDYHGIKVLVTYHPAYLLRNPSAKKMVWEDMQLLMKELGLLDA